MIGSIEVMWYKCQIAGQRVRYWFVSLIPGSQSHVSQRSKAMLERASSVPALGGPGEARFLSLFSS